MTNQYAMALMVKQRVYSTNINPTMALGAIYKTATNSQVQIHDHKLDYFGINNIIKLAHHSY